MTGQILVAKINSIGLIGYGNFGKFMHTLFERFAPDINFRVHSPSRQKSGSGGGGVFYSLEEVAECDAVFLCVPISRYKQYLEMLRPLLLPHTVLIDVATIKVYTGELIRDILKNQPYISTHPMFGPESYAKQNYEVTGLRVVVTESNLPKDKHNQLLQHIGSLGFSVVEKSAEQHDKEMAETLFLTHYVGQVISRGGFERTEIDTVSFGYLMDAVDSVRHDTQLFEDVQRFNPYCKDVIQRFDDSENEVKNLLLNTTQD